MHAASHRDKLTVGILGSLLLLCFACRQSMALDPTRDLSQFNRQVWLTENGLPQNTVHSITQAKDGYVWIATEEGLARFDGIKFTVFDKQNTPELKSNDIRVLLEDRRGALWIGTTDGLVRLMDSKFTAFTTRDGLPSNVIDALCEDQNDSLWVATAAGMAHFSEGSVWIGTAGGLSRFSDKHFSSFRPGDGLANEIILSIFEDREGSLWLGTESGGLSLLRDK